MRCAVYLTLSPLRLAIRTVTHHRNHLVPPPSNSVVLSPMRRGLRIATAAELTSHPRLTPPQLKHGEKAARELFEHVQTLLARVCADRTLTARGVYGFWPANTIGDDIVVYRDDSRREELARLPMLRQQEVIADVSGLAPEVLAFETDLKGKDFYHSIGDIQTGRFQTGKQYLDAYRSRATAGWRTAMRNGTSTPLRCGIFSGDSPT